MRENMTDQDEYDLNGYTTMPIGVELDSKITEIKKGLAKDFFGDEYWQATMLTKQEIAEAKNTPAIEIHTENGAKLAMILPSKKELHPKATLARFIAKYGTPSVGQVIKTKIDQNGFYRIVV